MQVRCVLKPLYLLAIELDKIAIPMELKIEAAEMRQNKDFFNEFEFMHSISYK